MPDSDLSLIERVIKRARRKAWTHASISIAVTALLLVSPGGRTWTIFALSLNILAAFFLGRRALRLRPSGPVMTALRERPQDIASVHQWPAKMPPQRPPVALEIRTRTGALASVFLDPKQPGESVALVAALRARSPDATVVYPSVNVA